MKTWIPCCWKHQLGYPRRTRSGPDSARTFWRNTPSKWTMIPTLPCSGQNAKGTSSESADCAFKGRTCAILCLGRPKFLLSQCMPAYRCHYWQSTPFLEAHPPDCRKVSLSHRQAGALLGRGKLRGLGQRSARGMLKRGPLRHVERLRRCSGRCTGYDPGPTLVVVC